MNVVVVVVIVLLLDSRHFISYERSIFFFQSNCFRFGHVMLTLILHRTMRKPGIINVHIENVIVYHRDSGPAKKGAHTPRSLL